MMWMTHDSYWKSEVPDQHLFCVAALKKQTQSRKKGFKGGHFAMKILASFEESGEVVMKKMYKKVIGSYDSNGRPWFQWLQKGLSWCCNL